MEQDKTPPVTNPEIDVEELLEHLMGDTGEVRAQLGGFRIRVYHTKAFPWAEVLKALLYRDFKVYVTRRHADLYVEAAL